MNIGWIGTGLMGSRIAGRLLAKSFDVSVYNRTKEKAIPLLEQGAHWCTSPAGIGKTCDIVMTMLSDSMAIEAVALVENDGFLAYLSAGSIWVDLSTVGPIFSKKMAELSNARTIHFIDAPVAGSIGPAERGELTTLVGGSLENVRRLTPLIESYSKKIIHAGAVGMGSSLKLVINMILGNSMVSFCEALVFGNELGLKQELLLDTLLGGPVTAPYLASKRSKFVQHSYSAEFPLRHMAKDLRLIENCAHQANLEGLLFTDTTKRLMNSDAAKEHWDEDFSALLEVISQLRPIKDIE